MEAVIIVLLVVLILSNIFWYFWVKNMKNILVEVAKKLVDVDNAIDKYTQLVEEVERKDVYLNDPNLKKLVYNSYKLKDYLRKAFKKVFEIIDFQTIEELDE